MYNPDRFKEGDVEFLRSFMIQHDFATLITYDDGTPVANHLPVLLDVHAGPTGRILGHVARANRQWQCLNGEQEVLVIFQGPHSYISPNWYEPGLAVPTWNYGAVHAYGTPKLITDEQAILDQILLPLISKHESKLEKPWSLDLPTKELKRLMAMLIGFEIPIARLEGKLKLSQDESEASRKKVVQILTQSLNDQDKGLADLMEQRALPRNDKHNGK